MISWSTIPSSAVGFKLSINVRRKNFLKISTYLRIWVHAYGIETAPNSQSVSFWKLRPGNMGRLIFTTELDTTIPTVRNGVERVPHLSSEDYQDKGRTPICKYTSGSPSERQEIVAIETVDALLSGNELRT